METRSNGHHLFRIILAIVFVCFGIIALGNNLNWWDIDDLFLEWWPMILVLVGLVTIFAPGGSWGGGIFLIFVGLLFLLHSHGIYDISDLIWPALLIMVGVMIWPRRKRISNTQDPHNTKTRSNIHETGSDHVFNINTLFNSQREVIKDDQVAGGHGTAVFGNLDIDLRQTSPKPGAYFEFTAIFGNMTIMIPSDWKIIKHGGPVFGKVNDLRINLSEINSNKTVTIEMNAVFGRIDLLN